MRAHDDHYYAWWMGQYEALLEGVLAALDTGDETLLTAYRDLSVRRLAERKDGAIGPGSEVA